MKKVIGFLAVIALAFGVFLASNTVASSSNAELNLSDLTSLNTAVADCQSNPVVPVYGWVTEACGDDGEGNIEYCRVYKIIGTQVLDNNGACVNGQCWSGEGDVYTCYGED